MTDTFEFTLDNPLTEEQWDMITDVDFDHTDRITFHTKHGKEVEFAKVIRCKGCKHRPIVIDAEGNGFDYDFPDERCPCQCEDGWYNWMPRDEWYCANGERKEE